MTEDRTLPKIPLAVADTAPGVKVIPRCDACGTVVDLSDPNHHVCVPDAAGDVDFDGQKFRKATLIESTALFEEAFAAATEAAKEAPLEP